MQDYIDTSTAAKLLEISERMVRINAAAGKYGEVKYIDGRGGDAGKVIQISVWNLPIEAQIKYVMQQMDAPLHVTTLDDVPEKYRVCGQIQHSISRRARIHRNPVPLAERLPASRHSRPGTRIHEPRVAEHHTRLAMGHV